MAQERTTIWGFDRNQFTSITLWLAGMGIIISMFVMQNGNINALRADFRALESRVYDLSVEVAEMNARLANVEAELIDVNSRLRNVETGLKSLESRVGNLETRLDNLETRVGNVETSLDSLDSRVENIERSLPDYGLTEDRLSNLEQGQTRLNLRVDSIAGSE